jgi:hypothetical protein
MRSETSVTRKDKFIAWFLIAQATAGFMLLAWLLWRSGSLPLGVWITFLPLAVLALAAGLGSLSGKRWGVLLGVIVFALQTPIVITQSFRFYVWLVIHLDVTAVWTGHAQLGINLVGLAMLIWSGSRFLASIKRTRVPRAA